MSDGASIFGAKRPDEGARQTPAEQASRNWIGAGDEEAEENDHGEEENADGDGAE